MDSTLLNLPWQVQVALAGGYAAYLVANLGNRTHHQPIDVAFSTLVFGLFASVIYSKAAISLGEVWGGVVAFFGCAVIGALWRKVGRPLCRYCIRKLNISYSDDDPSALATLMSDTKFAVTQIAVRLDDGRWIRCDDTTQFAHSPFGPCVIGPAGDVAMYPTHVDEADGSSRPQNNVTNPDYGDRIVYLPADRITEIAIRHKKKKRRA